MRVVLPRVALFETVVFLADARFDAVLRTGAFFTAGFVVALLRTGALLVVALRVEVLFAAVFFAVLVRAGALLAVALRAGAFFTAVFFAALLRAATFFSEALRAGDAIAAAFFLEAGLRFCREPGVAASVALPAEDFFPLGVLFGVLLRLRLTLLRTRFAFID